MKEGNDMLHGPKPHEDDDPIITRREAALLVLMLVVSWLAVIGAGFLVTQIAKIVLA